MTKKDVLERVPISKPPFGIADLKKSIPPHYFKRSLVHSFASFFRDLFIIHALYYLAANYIPLLPQPLSYAAWPLYWFAQGSVLMGFWILGHECGQVVLSDVGIIAVLYVFYHLLVTQGLKLTLFIYAIPLFVMSGFFVFLTYLNHTHPSIAHYDSTEWDWLRGALSTIDRDFGILNRVFHNANQTHVIHHLFPTIPHYHAIEAREAVKPMLGDYYKYDDTPVLKAMWRDTKECIYVEPDEKVGKKGVYWYFK